MRRRARANTYRKSSKLEPVSIGGIERGWGELDGQGMAPRIEGVGEAGGEEGKVARPQGEAEALKRSRIGGVQSDVAREKVEPFPLAVVVMVAADVAGEEFDGSNVADGLRAVAELGEFALGEQEALEQRGVRAGGTAQTGQADSPQLAVEKELVSHKFRGGG